MDKTLKIWMKWVMTPFRPILEFVSDIWNPYPKCRGCNREERILLTGRVLFLVMLSISGYILINQVDGDVKSQCCKQLLQCAQTLNPDAYLMEGDEGVNIKFMENYEFEYQNEADIPDVLSFNDTITVH